MFNLAVLKDSVRVSPEQFGDDLHTAVAAEINSKFANKVIRPVGLCICLHDLLEVGDGFIHPGDGAAHIHVKFRMVVFKPFIGEIIVGKIRSFSGAGISVSLDFFDDILIPKEELQKGSYFSQTDQVWLWRHESGEEYDMEKKDPIRFKVIAESFNEVSPTRGKGQAASSAGARAEENTSPYSLKCSIKGYGLGLLSWW